MKCFNCNGKKFVNHVKMHSNGSIITKSNVRECLICKGTGISTNGKDTKV